MKKIHHFYNDLYMENFYFCPNFTDEEYKDAIIKNTNMDWVGSCLSNARATEITLDNGKYFIFIQLKNIDDINSLVHECFHASNYLMNRKGLRPDARNDEAQAYLIQWIFNECYSEIKRIKKSSSSELKAHNLDSIRHSFESFRSKSTVKDLVSKSFIINNNPFLYDYVDFLKEKSEKIVHGVYKTPSGEIFVDMKEVDNPDYLRGVDIKYAIIDERVK